jgi:hypothetical protein
MTFIDNNIKNYYTETEYVNLTNTVNLILKCDNNIIIRGYSRIIGFNGKMSIDIKDQVVLNHIYESATKSTNENKIKEFVSKTQDASGIFALNTATTKLQTTALGVITIDKLTDMKNTIQKNFSVSNLLIIEYDGVVPNSEIKDFDLSMTNKQYNEQYLGALATLTKDITNKNDADIEDKNKNKADGLDIGKILGDIVGKLGASLGVPLALSLASVGGLYVLTHLPKKK